MTTDSLTEARIFVQIRQLPPEAIQKLEEFIEQLSQSKNNSDRHLTLAASKLSESVLAKIWDNAEDAEYDNL
ncbi:MAG: toxin-antitoxin system, antitoxin component, Xre family protein [Cyanobacteria bacterium RI_101]|nr:toxin-antitoxin system, antitoxin component, Xre family protein [Cyanobacteria bacterium RI_101]